MGDSQLSSRPRVDGVLSTVVETFETAFPGRVRGYYVHGSTADNTSIATSDVDVDVVVKERFRDAEERAQFIQIAQTMGAGGDLELDVDVVDEAELQGGVEPAFKFGSDLLYREDIRASVPLVPIEVWGRERMYRGYFLMVRVFRRSSPIRYPLGFPDPEAEFFGYAERRVPLSGGNTVSSTRDLSRVTGWLATALSAYEGKQYVARKRDCHLVCRSLFHDEWASLLEEIYVVCRGRWHCLIPDDPGERRQLQEICRRVLAFENHFLTSFKPFLLSELRLSAHDEESRAVWLMREIPFADPEIGRALNDRPA